MNTVSKLILGVLALSLVAGCSSTGKRDNPAPVNGQGAATTGAGGQTGYDPARLGNPNDPLSQRVIFFEYDSNNILPEYRAAIDAHARFLVSNPNQNVTLEGHADERGAREYNIALGERRAQSIKSMFVAAGVPAQRIMTISYGEERPAVLGGGEAAMAQNRRVEIVY
jgi:peptidoglycan-associated lipoprotein